MFPKCKCFVKQFHQHEIHITCNACDYDIDFISPCYREYFVVLNSEDELKSLVECNAEYYLEDMQQERPDGSYKDVYDEKKYKEFQNSLTPKRKVHTFLSGLFKE